MYFIFVEIVESTIVDQTLWRINKLFKNFLRFFLDKTSSFIYQNRAGFFFLTKKCHLFNKIQFVGTFLSKENQKDCGTQIHVLF